jgi:CheY-like chemotaxis protein
VSVLSHVLVIEPKKDPEIERVLESPGFDFCFTSEIDEALELTVALLPSVIILDMLIPGLNSWRLIADIWEEANKRSHSPAIILVTEQAAQWHANHFGPVRFSDRRHLRETFQDAILAVPHHTSAPNLGEETAWEAVRDHVWARGNERFKVEQHRMRKIGILDEKGLPTSKEWPADMRPGSTTDVAT